MLKLNTLKFVFVVLFVSSLFSCGKNPIDVPVDGIDIPGGQTTNKYGSVSVSGTDTSQIGSSFSGDTLTVDSTSTGTASDVTVAGWGDATFEFGVVAATVVAVTFNISTGDVVAINLRYLREGNNWYYFLDCSTVPCTDISVDQASKKVTFSGLSVPVDTTETMNQATENINLQGILTYAE